jgi:hypothetical protein
MEQGQRCFAARWRIRSESTPGGVGPGKLCLLAYGSSGTVVTGTSKPPSPPLDGTSGATGSGTTVSGAVYAGSAGGV